MEEKKPVNVKLGSAILIIIILALIGGILFFAYQNSILKIKQNQSEAELKEIQSKTEQKLQDLQSKALELQKTIDEAKNKTTSTMTIAGDDLKGNYELKETPNTEGYLKISKATENSLDFSIESYWGTQSSSGPHTGNLIGTAKRIEKNKYVYTENEDNSYEYELKFTVLKDGENVKITVKDSGKDENGDELESYPMNGVNVDFDGEYIKKNSTV